MSSRREGKSGGRRDGWTAYQDSSSGRTYYHHAALGTTRWERPAQQTGELPDGWTAHQDSTGRAYYHHAASGTTSWERPAPLQQGRTETGATSVEKHGSAGGVPSTLPDGWTAHQDNSSGRTYYHHAASGTTSWERPAQEPTGIGGSGDSKDDDGGAEHEAGLQAEHEAAKHKAQWTAAAAKAAAARAREKREVVDRLREAAEDPEGVLASYEQFKKDFKAPGEAETTEVLCTRQGITFRPMVVEAHAQGDGRRPGHFRRDVSCRVAGLWVTAADRYRPPPK